MGVSHLRGSENGVPATAINPEKAHTDASLHRAGFFFEFFSLRRSEDLIERRRFRFRPETAGDAVK